MAEIAVHILSPITIRVQIMLRLFPKSIPTDLVCRYVWIGVSSKDKHLTNHTSDRSVAKMFVTQSYKALMQIYENKQYSYSELKSLQMLSMAIRFVFKCNHAFSQ